MPLTYSQVRSTEIDVDAQRSLMRMSKWLWNSEEADCIAAAVRSGALMGIYAEDQQKPALRARDKLHRGWWQLIPKGADSVVVLDPTDFTAPPLIAFRRTIRGDAARLDAAILKAWRTARRYLNGKIIPCTTGDVANIVPENFCSSDDSIGDGPDCCCKRINTIALRVVTVIPDFKTAVDALEGRCYLTKTIALMTFDVVTQRFFQAANTDGTSTEESCFNQEVCGRTGRSPENLFSDFRRIPNTDIWLVDYSLTVQGSCAPLFVMTGADGSFVIKLSPTRRAVGILFRGSHRAITIEVSASINSCPPKRVLQHRRRTTFDEDRNPLVGIQGGTVLTCGACICPSDGVPTPPWPPLLTV
jgi:hypothetical protein